MAIAKNKVFYWVINRKMLISGGDEHFLGGEGAGVGE